MAPCVKPKWQKWINAWCPNAVSRKRMWPQHIRMVPCLYLFLIYVQTPSPACCRPGPSGASAVWRVGVACGPVRGCWSRIPPAARRSWSRRRSACCPSAVSGWFHSLLLKKPFLLLSSDAFKQKHYALKLSLAKPVQAFSSTEVPAGSVWTAGLCVQIRNKNIRLKHTSYLPQNRTRLWFSCFICMFERSFQLWIWI